VIDGLSKEKIKELKRRPREKYLKLLEIFDLNERKLKEAYYNLVEAIKEEAQAQVLNDDDMAIVMTGVTGAGKSTLCQILAYELDPAYDYRTNTTLRTEHRMQLNIELPPGSVHVMEEMSLDADRMSYRTSEGIGIKRMFHTNRKKRHVIIMNLPEIDDLLPYLFDRRVRVWIHIIYRGLAMIFFAQDFMIFGNRFGIPVDELKKLTRDIRTEKEAIAFVKFLTKLPSFKGFFWFPRYTKKFTAKMYQEFNEYIKTELDKVYKEMKENKGKAATRYRELLRHVVRELYKMGWSVADIHKLFFEGDRQLLGLRTLYVWLDGLVDRPKPSRAKAETVIPDEELEEIASS